MTMILKTRTLALAAALAACGTIAPATAQDFTFGWNPRSGDVWVNTWLSDINRYGSRYQRPFIDEMVRYHGAPRDLVRELLLRRDWAPGDIYYACAIAQVIGRPCRYVVDEWERSHGQGWGVVAKRLGIKPGSAQFHQLKRGFVTTYDRWARPIVIDQDLYREFPDRAVKAKEKHRGAPGKSERGKHPGRGKGNKGKGRGKH